MISQESINIIKSTVPAIKQNGETLTREFYRDMFERYPEVKPMFSTEKQKSGHQPKALANAILAAAQNIDNLEKILPTVEKIGKVHVNVNVKPEHYPIVGECLLKAIKTVMKDDATPEVLKAWEEAYTELAKIFIGVEDRIYKEEK
ncbi:bacitracin resistance protein BacA [Helicobacter sp. 13S00401-1]|nr:bacitracin resistance protein BacA [Helicobacter sp. 13S00401-1]